MPRPAKTGDVVDVAGNGEEALPTEAQRARRRRILRAAADLATEGGFDAVQMREVADRADVALGTLYRYFPSKVHLLVSAMAQELAAMRSTVRPRSAAGGGGAPDRVFRVVVNVTRALGRNRP